MTRYRLHTTDLSPFGQRAKMALAVKGLLDEVELVDTFGGTDALGELAPMRQIPILETPDGPIPESQVIVDYLDKVHPKPPLQPTMPAQAARAQLIARIADLYLAPHFLTLIIAMRGTTLQADISAALDAQARGLRYVEHYLGPGAFAVGDALSVADLALAPFLFYVRKLGEWHGQTPLAGFPRAKAYLASVQQAPAVAQAFAEMGHAYMERTEQLSSRDK